MSRRNKKQSPHKHGIQLQDNIRWWTKDFRGYFDHDLYIRVLKAKMSVTSEIA